MARDTSEVDSVLAESLDNVMMELVRDSIRESKLPEGGVGLSSDARKTSGTGAPHSYDARHLSASALAPGTASNRSTTPGPARVPTINVVTRTIPRQHKGPRPVYPTMCNLQRGALAYEGLPVHYPASKSGYQRITITGPGVRCDLKPWPPAAPNCFVREEGRYVTKRLIGAGVFEPPTRHPSSRHRSKTDRDFGPSEYEGEEVEFIY